jgi:hypothetical protein
METFFISKDKDSVQILPITNDNKIITVIQYRPNLEEKKGIWVLCMGISGGILVPRKSQMERMKWME